MMSSAARAVVGVFLVVALVDLVILLGFGGGDWLVPITGILFAAMIGSAIVGVIQRRRDWPDRKQLDCSLRVVSGKQDGLTDQWRSGVAVWEPGRITFRRTIGGVRFLSGEPSAIDVLQIDIEERRIAGWRTATVVSPGSTIVSIQSGTATLECAILGRQADWAIDRVRG